MTPTPVRLRLFCIAALAFVTSNASATETLLVRTSGSWFYGPTMVFTPGSTSVAAFWPLSPPILISGTTKARFSYQMTKDFGDCKLRAAVRFSNDGVTFSGEGSPNSTYVTSENGIFADSAYADLQAVGGTSPGPWIQFGAQTLNRTNTSVGLCMATLRVEPGRN